MTNTENIIINDIASYVLISTTSFLLRKSVATNTLLLFDYLIHMVS
ncbi:hypothetical protein [Geosporobacter ferrireducens]|nr:hypothetical protein [Geosporobacter ferrireducens]